MSVKAKKSIKTSKQDTLFYAVIYAVILFDNSSLASYIYSFVVIIL